MTNLANNAAYIVSGMWDYVVPPVFQEAIDLALRFTSVGMTNLKYESLNTGHYYPYGKPAEVV